MSDASDPIECGVHGQTPVTFACRHLVHGIACGFHASVDDESDLWPDAWCDLCEDAFQAAGGAWTAEASAVADIEVLCTHCYEAARARNLAVPPLARSASSRLPGAELKQLVHHAVHAAQALQDESNERWGWRDKPNWHYDGEASTLLFKGDHDAVIADVTLVGSYSTKTNTFQWAWATFADGADEAARVAALRVFGEVRGIEKLTTPNWACDEAVGWEMTALAPRTSSARKACIARRWSTYAGSCCSRIGAHRTSRERDAAYVQPALQLTVQAPGSARASATASPRAAACRRRIRRRSCTTATRTPSTSRDR